MEQAYVDLKQDGTDPKEIRSKEVNPLVMELFEMYRVNLLTKDDVEISDKSNTLVRWGL